MKSPESTPQKRAWVARAFTVVEDIVYIGLGLLLAGSSVILLVTGVLSFGQNLMAGSFATNIVALLDRILLILLLVELLYTVQVSFREHTLVPEPFLLVGLIAAIRRVLVLTATFADVQDKPELVFQHIIVESRRADALDRDTCPVAVSLAKDRRKTGRRARNLSTRLFLLQLKVVKRGR